MCARMLDLNSSFSIFYKTYSNEIKNIKCKKQRFPDTILIIAHLDWQLHQTKIIRYFN